MLQGALDMLILRALVIGPAHGHTIAHAIEHRSEDVLQVEHGSLYPALHRLEQKGWLKAAWRQSDTGREAKFYTLTRKGQKQLATVKATWQRLAISVALIFSEGE
jgi:PadR family transcriptional regulator PadR